MRSNTVPCPSPRGESLTYLDDCFLRRAVALPRVYRFCEMVDRAGNGRYPNMLTYAFRVPNRGGLSPSLRGGTMTPRSSPSVWWDRDSGCSLGEIKDTFRFEVLLPSCCVVLNCLGVTCVPHFTKACSFISFPPFLPKIPLYGVANKNVQRKNNAVEAATLRG